MAASENLEIHVDDESDQALEPGGGLNDADNPAAWEAYIRSHPWLACGSAAAVGFVVAPRLRPAAGTTAPERPAEAAKPAVETAAAQLAGENLARELLKLAAATMAEQSVAQLFELGREFLGQPVSVERKAPVDAQGLAEPIAAAAVDQASAQAGFSGSPLLNSLRDLDQSSLERRAEQVIGAHPLGSLFAAAAAGVLLGIIVKKR